jgi:lactoylglutathione lyase
VLEVSAGLLGRRRLLIEVAEVAQILPEERTLILRGHPRLLSIGARRGGIRFDCQDGAVVRRMAGMARYLHTMVRITDPEKSRAFYEALGMEFRRDLEIVREGEVEATNYFFGFPGQEEELELTFNHDGRGYELGTAYGHIAIGVDDLDETLGRLKEQGIEPEREPYRVREGGSRLCFVRDPDSYRVELIDQSGA